jgi:hypothetical protein
MLYYWIYAISLCISLLYLRSHFVPKIIWIDKIKKAFDRHTKEDDFKVGDLVLKWAVGNEDRGKHGKFDHLWLGPFKIVAYHGNNSYLLQEHNEDLVGGGPVNGRFLKHYLT